MTAIRTSMWLALIAHVTFIVLYLLGAVGLSLIFAGLSIGFTLIALVRWLAVLRRRRKALKSQ